MSESENLPPKPLEKPPTKIYSVPRRFGIRTIMGVATAYALLLWGMQQLDWPPNVIIFNAVFLTLVGVMQVVWPKSPRWVSMVAGGVTVMGIFVVHNGLEGIVYNMRFADPCILLWVLIAGLIYGYLGGVLVAGVFLVMDAITRRLTGKRGATRW